MTVQYQVARGSLGFLANMGRVGVLDSFGITREEFEKLTGPVPWVGTDRHRVSQTLNALMHAGADILALPRFDLNAEYVAASIAIFVHPVNVYAACRFVEKVSTASPPGS